MLTAAYHGEQALLAFHQQKYQLVITDINIPRMNGLSLLREIKKVILIQERSFLPAMIILNMRKNPYVLVLMILS